MTRRTKVSSHLKMSRQNVSFKLPEQQYKKEQIKTKAEKMARYYYGRSKAGEGLKIIKDDFLAEELRVSRV